eukprot:s777_g18.t1
MDLGSNPGVYMDLKKSEKDEEEYDIAATVEEEEKKKRKKKKKKKKNKKKKKKKKKKKLSKKNKKKKKEKNEKKKKKKRNGAEEKLSTEKPNQVNYETPRETLMMVLQRDGNQLGFASPSMRADKELFIDFTGAPADQAAIFLEMAGGNVETAVEIYMSSQGGQRGFCARLVECDLADLTRGWAGGIPQPKNGPCGVIAVVHALVLAKQYNRPMDQIQVCADDVASVIGDMLLRCRQDSAAPVQLCRPKEKGAYGPAAELDILQVCGDEAVRNAVVERIADFQGPGGIIDLVYSAVFTRGIEKVKQECLLEAGELPLVPRLHHWNGLPPGACNCQTCRWLVEKFCFLAGGRSRSIEWLSCSMVLHSVFQRLYLEEGHVLQIWKLKRSRLGDDNARPAMLGWVAGQCPALVDAKIPAAAFISPAPCDRERYRMALLHPNSTNQSQARLKRLFRQILMTRNVSLANTGNGATRQGKMKSPDLQGEQRPADAEPEPKFQQEDSVHLRAEFKTMDFSLVPADSLDWCQKCSRSRKECGWSLWIPYAELPPKRQAWCMSQPEAEILEVSGRELPDC